MILPGLSAPDLSDASETEILSVVSDAVEVLGGTPDALVEWVSDAIATVQEMLRIRAATAFDTGYSAGISDVP